MKLLNIALLQLIPGANEDENLAKGIACCRSAQKMGADIALFPEMWNCGYSLPQDPGEWHMFETARDDAFVQAYALLARELNMAIAVTYLEKYSPSPRNTVTLFDRHGREALTYAKVHTCDFDAEHHLTRGEDFPVCELDTAKGSVKIGAMICYDREFPESARVLMLRGAEIILVPNACPMEINRISQLRARAYENMLGIATSNYARGKPDCNGHSTAFDGIAYLKISDDEFEGRDTLVVEAGENEGIFIAPMPVDAIRDYRSREVHGNAFRRPELYKPLTDGRINEPFIRVQRRE